MKDLPSHIGILLIAVCMLVAFTVVLGGFIFLIHKRPSTFMKSEKKTATYWTPRSIEKDLPPDQRSDTITYGYQIITNTSLLIGPRAKSESNRFAGNNLSCTNCHLQAGRQIGSGSFVGVTNRYPQFRGRENKIGTIEDRINGCMERSMNGDPLPVGSVEMRAMVSYMQWLSEGVPEDAQEQYRGYVNINLPQVSADSLQGHLLYEVKCKLCHGDSGEGTLIPGDEFTGYLYPPLAGDDSFNDGAGMNRVITAAEFIKGNMPFGASYDSPLLSDEEAYHLAAYINSLPRPKKANKEVDFPDIILKPVSTPYGPYADNFSPRQHKYGPFPPIMKFYKEKYGRNKSK